MREICTSGSVGGEGRKVLTYPATEVDPTPPRISLRSIRATKVTFGRPSIICEFGAGLGPTLLDAARLTIYPISASA